MKTTWTRRAVALVAMSAAAAGCVAPRAAVAQAYPAKTVRVVVGVPPGGLQDQLARAIAADLGKLWNQSVIVENRPGAGGIPAAESVARSAPDGHTVLQTDNITYLTNEFLRTAKLPYDLEKDFAPAIVLVAANNILVASPKLPANTLQELLALARARPGSLNYGSFGTGSIAHIDMEALALQAGVKVTHVPYKGGAPLLQALMADEVHFAMTGMTAAIPLIKQGRVKALAYGGEKRSALFPGLPTLSEAGLARFTSSAWFCWVVPSGTPPAVIGRIAADTGRVISAPAFREKHIDAAGHELVNADGAKLAEMLAADKKQFAQRVQPLNLKLD
jgi:tripartite-type tricarboxylate transporter receptor subunit TctC